jgi:hypothetical protein
LLNPLFQFKIGYLNYPEKWDTGKANQPINNFTVGNIRIKGLSHNKLK